MRSNRPLLLLLLALAATVAVFWLIRGFRGEAGVPDTSSKVDGVTSDPDPRPLSADGEGPLEAPPSDDPASSSSAPVTPIDPELLATWQVEAAITGIVLDDATDLPVAGAKLTVRRIAPAALKGAPIADGPALAETTSESDGTFALDAHAGQWLRLVVDAEGYAPLGLRIASTGTDVEVRLGQPAVLSVRVLDPSGSRVPDAWIEARVGDTQASVGARLGEAELLLPAGSAYLRAGSRRHGMVRVGPFALVAGQRATAEVVVTLGIGLIGRVVDADTGAPIEGAAVRAARPGVALDLGQTDADGQFIGGFGVDVGGEGERVFVSVVGPRGYASALEPVILRGTSEGPVQTVEIALEKGEDWLGEVVAPPGVSPAGVQVYYTGNGVGQAERGASTTTDENGRFALPPPPPAAPGRRVVLVAEKDDLVAALALRPHQLRPEPLMLVLDGGAAIAGRVVDESGAPARGATIRLWPDWERSAGALSPAQSRMRLANERGFSDLATATDSDGRFVMRGVPRTRFRLQVRFKGKDRWPGVTIDADRGSTDVGTITLGTGISLDGRVTDRTGRLLPGARVRLQGTSDDFRYPLEATADARGEYGFVDLAPGTYALGVEQAGHAPFVESVTVESDMVYDVTLEAGGALVLSVSAGDTPYAGRARVTLRAARDGRVIEAPRSVRVEAGVLTLHKVRSGVFSVEIMATDGRVGYADDVSVGVDRQAEAHVVLEAASTLEGRVTSAGGGAIPSARLLLIHGARGTQHSATAMIDGRYRVAGLAPGAWRIFVDGRGGVPATFDVDVAPGTTTTFDAELEGGGHVRVRVVDNEGREMAGALLLFRDQERAYPASPPDRTGRDGVAVRKHLPVGRIAVSARLDGYEGRASVLVVEGQTNEVTVRVVRSR